MRLNPIILVCLYLATFSFVPVVAICEPNIPVKLTNFDVICGSPSISDDGTKIAFIAYLYPPEIVRDDPFVFGYREFAEIFVINSDGSDLKQVTNSTAQGAVPVLRCSISGDGSKIVFAGTVDYTSAHARSGIFIVNSDGSELKHVTNYTSYSSPSITNDGSKVAFTTKLNGYVDLFVINSDGTGLKQLTSNSLEVIIPQISGDGSKIVFLQYPHNSSDETELFVVNSDGTGLKQLTSNSLTEYYPSISDDGSKIAFLSIISSGIGISDVFVINSDGSGLKQLTNKKLYSTSEFLAMSGDGSKIITRSAGDRGCRLSVVNSDGSGGTNLKQMSTRSVSKVL